MREGEGRMGHIPHIVCDTVMIRCRPSDADRLLAALAASEEGGFAREPRALDGGRFLEIDDVEFFGPLARDMAAAVPDAPWVAHTGPLSADQETVAWYIGAGDTITVRPAGNGAMLVSAATVFGDDAAARDDAEREWYELRTVLRVVSA